MTDSRPYRIFIYGTAQGVPTDFDGKWVAEYDPTRHTPSGGYDGGILKVTSDPEKALKFDNAAEAFEKWRQAYRMRPDGEPNRPLTAFSVQVTQELNPL